jgi:hypothetical protein
MYIHAIANITKRRAVMSTFNIKQTRKFVPGKLALIAVLAAFGAQVEAGVPSAQFVDTQTKVGAVVSGARADQTVTQATGTDVRLAAVDTQESTRQVLAGTHGSSSEGSHEAAASSHQPSIGSNGRSSGEVQKLTQALVLGRAAS